MNDIKVLLENTSKLSSKRLEGLVDIVNTVMASGGLQKSMGVSEIKHLHFVSLELSVKIVRLNSNLFSVIVCDSYMIKIEVVS
jgi:hypothetical protein